jgi:hypothetical protein
LIPEYFPATVNRQQRTVKENAANLSVYVEKHLRMI